MQNQFWLIFCRVGQNFENERYLEHEFHRIGLQSNQNFKTFNLGKESLEPEYLGNALDALERRIPLRAAELPGAFSSDVLRLRQLLTPSNGFESVSQGVLAADRDRLDTLLCDVLTIYISGRSRTVPPSKSNN